MTVPPWLVFSLVSSLALASCYQLLSRRAGWRLFGYWALVLAGFLGGEATAELTGLSVTRYGDLRLVPDGLGAGLALLGLWFLGV